jgi:hypothetical protein
MTKIKDQILDDNQKKAEWAEKEYQHGLDNLAQVDEEQDGDTKAKMISELSDSERATYYRTHPQQEDGDSYRDNLEDR